MIIFHESNLKQNKGLHQDVWISHGSYLLHLKTYSSDELFPVPTTHQVTSLLSASLSGTSSVWCTVTCGGGWWQTAGPHHSQGWSGPTGAGHPGHRAWLGGGWKLEAEEFLWMVMRYEPPHPQPQRHEWRSRCSGCCSCSTHRRWAGHLFKCAHSEPYMFDW